MTPERTYAIVLGIGEYAAGPEWELRGAPHDALAFAECLVSKGVPRSNVTLFVSPGQGDAARQALQRGLEPRVPNRENVYRLLTAEPGASRFDGDLLIVYWAGHGVVTNDGKRRLFYADATNAAPVNLDVESLVGRLRSSAVRIEQHVLVLDTCANFAPGRLLPPLEELPAANPNPRSRVAWLTAATLGEYAFELAGGTGGTYTRALLAAMREQERWPLDLRALHESIRRRLPDDETRRQSAGLFTFMDWYGSGDRSGGVPAPLGNPVRRVRVHTAASNHELICIFGTSALIGRSRDCDVSLRRVSRRIGHRHASLHYVGPSGFEIEDLGSLNGTTVDLQTVYGRTALREGAVVGLAADLDLRFERRMDVRSATGALVYLRAGTGELARYVLAPTGVVPLADGIGRLPGVRTAVDARIVAGGGRLFCSAGGALEEVGEAPQTFDIGGTAVVVERLS